jgi:quercetin dioxygenase-like cupin family protein
MSGRNDRVLLSEPTLIENAAATEGVWGNEKSGFVPTRFYGMSRELMVLSLTLPPGGGFRAFGDFRAYFDSHACLYVLAGQYTYQNPETGEVRTARQGEMLFFHEKLWHYGHNFGDTELHVLEVFAPPADAAALADVPIPGLERMVDIGALEALQRQDAQGPDNPRLRNDSNAVEALIAGKPNIWTRIYADTARIFLAIIKLLPGQDSETITAPFDMIYYLDEGESVIATQTSGLNFQVGAGDVVFVPANEPHRLSNQSDRSFRGLMAGAGPFASVKSQAE